jgi:hypothetical protein
MWMVAGMGGVGCVAGRECVWVGLAIEVIVRIGLWFEGKIGFE